MLQLLPPQGYQLIHMFIQLMWASHYTPSPWKHSITTLLFKDKGTPLWLKFYRRIGLECTIYKLWTRMITWAMSDYAERHNIITYTQGGFRNKRTTADQLELLVMLLEDAKLTKQDIYLLMVDFSEAFDTIARHFAQIFHAGRVNACGPRRIGQGMCRGHQIRRLGRADHPHCCPPKKAKPPMPG